MSHRFAPCVGTTFSADIAVPEHDREVRFYAQVLGTGDRPLWRDDLMNSLGMPVIGLGARTPDHASLPLQWMPHIQVADVAASVQRALDLDGGALMHHVDDEGRSQWAVLLDPNGAAFGIIPVIPAEAMPPSDAFPDAAEPVGRIAWIELTVPDAAAARDFYRQVVGWSVQDAGMEDAGYTMLGEDGAPAAGIRQAHGAHAEAPPVWMLHLPVGDLAESIRRVEEEGGTVLETRRGDDEAFVYAAVQDPIGAYVALTRA